MLFDCLKAMPKSRHSKCTVSFKCFEPPQKYCQTLLFSFEILFFSTEKLARFSWKNHAKSRFQLKIMDFSLSEKKLQAKQLSIWNIDAASLNRSKVRAQKEKEMNMSSWSYGFHKYNVLTVDKFLFMTLIIDYEFDNRIGFCFATVFLNSNDEIIHLINANLIENVNLIHDDERKKEDQREEKEYEAKQNKT